MLGYSQRGKGEKTSFLSQACSKCTAAGRHPGSKTKLDKALKKQSKRTRAAPTQGNGKDEHSFTSQDESSGGYEWPQDTDSWSISVNLVWFK